ncbi:hypothetical protein EIP86_009221 [Pleurotus ostreatoroseus]|nr:hypothetical protein EIP86_009221 [Pleurotus ostreatoroseus]
MVSNLPIPPHSEIYNTYGEHLTNAQLLARYGFVLEGNDNDTINFALEDTQEFWSSLTVNAARDPRWISLLNWDTFRAVFGNIAQTWPRYAGWSESNLVYHPYHDATSPTASTISPTFGLKKGSVDKQGEKLARASTPPHMCINSDAKISHALWICAALLALASAPTPDTLLADGAEHGVERTVATLKRLAARQMHWEAAAANAIEAQYTDADDDEGADQPADNQAFASTHSVADKSGLATGSSIPSWRHCLLAFFCVEELSPRRPTPAICGQSARMWESMGMRLCFAIKSCHSSLLAKAFFSTAIPP